MYAGGEGKGARAVLLCSTQCPSSICPSQSSPPPPPLHPPALDLNACVGYSPCAWAPPYPGPECLPGLRLMCLGPPPYPGPECLSGLQPMCLGLCAGLAQCPPPLPSPPLSPRLCKTTPVHRPEQRGKCAALEPRWLRVPLPPSPPPHTCMTSICPPLPPGCCRGPG